MITPRTHLIPVHALAASAALLTCAAAQAGTIYDEAISGDLTGNRLAPLNLGTLTPGSNLLIGQAGNADRDYFTITIATGQTLTNLNLVTYSGGDRVGFIGVQTGTIITEDPNSANVANLLGWTHFGPGGAPAGSDILDDIGNGPGAIGFSGALGPGTYSFWVQQLGTLTGYTFDFVVVPAPSAACAMGLGLLAASRRRR